MAYQRKPLWQCPKCGERFVSKNLWHSCGKFSLKALFSRSEPHVFELFLKLADAVEACGRVRIIPQKSRVVFQVRTRFVNVTPRKSHLIVGLVLAQKLDSDRFIKIEFFPPRLYLHHFRLESEAQLDSEFRSWLREAYLVGDQRHLD